MRALTVRQPWAWAIVHGGKNVENRTRNIAGGYRGPVAIHAGLQADEPALRDLPARPPEWVTAPRVFYYGVFLGVVDLVDVHHQVGSGARNDCCDSPWADAWYHGRGSLVHLVLANPRPLPEPIPCRGRLGLWTPPADVLEQLREVA